MKNLKNLSIDPNAKKVKLILDNNYPPIPKRVSSDIEDIPPIPSYCTRKLEKHCSNCPYYFPNHVTLFEFGRYIDHKDFKNKNYIGVLGTDSTIRCPFI